MRLVFLALYILLTPVCLVMGQDDWSVTRTGNGVTVSAGILKRKIIMNDHAAPVSTVSVSGSEIARSKGSDFTVTLWKASPNIMPLGITNTGQAGVEQSETIQNQTDALRVKNGKVTIEQNVKWVDSLWAGGSGFHRIFDEHHISVSAPQADRKELIIRFRASAQSGWDHLSAEVIYEIYHGFPAIRKRVRFHNNSEQWLKISHLTLDDIDVLPAAEVRTLLTPEERGIASSIVGFSDRALEKGVVVANEIPSMIRAVSAKGAAGYAGDYFEWVLGPSESFESEPVFMYAFSGKSYPTVSAVSTALDRCVEGDFKRFLKKHILLPFQAERNLAPLWCSWTNYAADVNAGNMTTAADIAARMGFKCFQIDAGWYDQGPNGGWAPSGRNPDKASFPDLKGFGRYLNGKGMRLGLWISVFRNETKSDDLAAMPMAASLPLVRRSGGVGMSLASTWRDYYANDLIYLHDTYGADYFKQDLSNICYGDIALGHESRTLKESYLRGLRGLLAAQDKVHASAPDVFLQLSHEIYWKTPGPPGDVAVLKHADSYHAAPNEYWGAGNRSKLVSDQWKYKPDSLSGALVKGAFRARNFLYGHRGLPLERIEIFGAATTNFRGSLSASVIDRQICSWLPGSPLSFSGDLSSLTAQNIDQYRRRFDLLARLQASWQIYSHFQFSGVPAPTDSDWHWWGKLNEQGYGAVVVLRGTGGHHSRKINIPWVTPSRRYRVKLSLAEKDLGYFSGKQLQDGRLTLTLPAMGQEILELSEN